MDRGSPQLSAAARLREAASRLADAANRTIAPLGLQVALVRRGTFSGLPRGLPRDLRVAVPGPQPVAFDVGANVGQTIDLLRSALDRPRIYAFEPASSTFATLEARRDPDVTCIQKALGAASGRLELTEYADSRLSSLHRLDAHESNIFRTQTVVGREEVEVTTVDSVAAAEGIDRIDLLKVDAQGYDLEVLRGAEALFARGAIGAALVEISFQTLYVGQGKAHDLLRHLSERRMQPAGFYEIYRRDGAIAWCTALFVRCPW